MSKNILIILPSAQDKIYFSKLESKGYNFIYADDENWNSYEASEKSFDPVSFTEKCIELGRKNKVVGVFTSDDLANFIVSIIGRELNLRSPSKESMFISNNKYYFRAFETPSINFFALDVLSNEWERIENFPFQIKPTSLYFSLLQSKINNKHELSMAITEMKENLPKWEEPFKKLFNEYVDLEKYPLAAKHIALCEEYINASSQHAVEGWSNGDGNHYIWAVSDNNYSVHGWLDNNSFPSMLPEKQIKNLEQYALNLVGKMEMKNSFWNIELWIMPDGSIKVTEINGRVCASMTTLYEHILGKTQYPLALSLATGEQFIDDFEIKANSTEVGAMFALVTNKKGKVSELLDIQALSEADKWESVLKSKVMYPEDMAIDWHQTGGVNCLARVWIVGRSYSEICALANNIRKKVIRS